MSIYTTAEIQDLERARLVELRKNLILEMKGTRRRGRYSSAYAILTSEEGFTGTRADILEQLNKQLENQ